MVTRIEVGLKDQSKDTRGIWTTQRIRNDLGINSVISVRTVSVYVIDDELTRSEAELLAKSLFCDLVVEKYSISTPLKSDLPFSHAIEIGFLPGVTDNVGTTAKEACEDLLGRKLRGAVYTSTQYFISGSISDTQAREIAVKILSNPLIERATIIPSREWDIKKGFPITIPKVVLSQTPNVEEIDINVPSDELLLLSQKRCLALSSEEWTAIKKYYNDQRTQELRRKYGLSLKPTDVEIEAIAQTWSEHCKHKIFNALIEYKDENGRVEKINSLFNTYIRSSTEEVSKHADWLVSVFSDNAGIIKFTDSYNAAFKVETHNAPSALDPYGGALTGIVGVNRDVIGAGLGAQLSFNTDVFCFAPPDTPPNKIPAGVLHPKRIFEGVRRGVEHGGNKMGVPTINGCIVFDERYIARPLVYCGTGGIMPSTIMGKKTHQKEIKDGYLAVMVGGRIGKDGIHGATFSSVHLDKEAPPTAVQIGDPITQRKMYDFLMEARDKGLYTAITDNGAGGLSSSIGELAQLSGGCEIELEKAPLKYPGLKPWEILLSESQERMTVAVPPEKISDFLSLSKKRSVESTVVGKFTNTGFFHVKYGSKTVGLLSMDFLHKGVPQMKLRAEWKKKESPHPTLPEPQNLLEELLELLSSYNICSKEYVIRQYDHEVGGGLCIKPLTGAENDGPSDAGVIKPLLNEKAGLVVGNGICPRYSDIDPYWMAACAFDEAIRNVVATGADPSRIAILDNFCWPDPVESEENPDGKEKLGALVRACKALYDCVIAYSAPCISGKDSMKNDFLVGKKRISIPPTLLFTSIGFIPDVEKAITIDFKSSGNPIYLLGQTKDELGSSQYFSLKGVFGGTVPRTDAKKFSNQYFLLYKAICSGSVLSSHDCSDGGLGVTLSESAFSGKIGAEVDLRRINYKGQMRDDYILFSESAGRILIEVKKGKEKEFERIMGKSVSCIGTTTSQPQLKIRGLNGKVILDASLEDLKSAWKRTLNW
ncbi:MAG: AIR synthase-related protein [Candidatus Anstonellales archaeon]